MKKIKLKFIGADPRTVAYGKIHERYLIKTENDLQTALDAKIIGQYHIVPMLKHIKKGEVLVLNDQGGWCPLRGTWEIVDNNAEDFATQFSIWAWGKNVSPEISDLKKLMLRFLNEHNFKIVKP